MHPVSHLPLIIPDIMRQLCRAGGNWEDVRYSVNELIATRFKFRPGGAGAARKLFSHRS